MSIHWHDAHRRQRCNTLSTPRAAQPRLNATTTGAARSAARGTAAAATRKPASSTRMSSHRCSLILFAASVVSRRIGTAIGSTEATNRGTTDETEALPEMRDGATRSCLHGALPEGVPATADQVGGRQMSDELQPMWRGARIAQKPGGGFAALPAPVTESCSCGSVSLYAEEPPKHGPHHQASCARYRDKYGNPAVRYTGSAVSL